VLEGGCGRGDKVYALQTGGYEAYGLDYAQRTVEAIKRSVPELTVCLGDLIPQRDIVRGHVHQTLKVPGHVGPMHPHHAIVDLAGVAAILTLDGGGVPPLLGIAGLVDHANCLTVGMVPGHDALGAIPQTLVNAPLLGQGRMTIWRSSIYVRVPGGYPGGHPHNAYIEMLLDGGAVGLVVALLLFVGFPVLAYARRCDDNGLLTTVLHAGLAGATTILVMSLTGQSFWPREGVDTILYLYTLMMAGCVYGIQQREKAIGQPLYGTGRPAHVTPIGVGFRTH